jgi:hypothetical protein
MDGVGICGLPMPQFEFAKPSSLPLRKKTLFAALVYP